MIVAFQSEASPPCGIIRNSSAFAGSGSFCQNGGRLLRHSICAWVAAQRHRSVIYSQIQAIYRKRTAPSRLVGVSPDEKTADKRGLSHALNATLFDAAESIRIENAPHSMARGAIVRIAFRHFRR
jgi:hypothetical protein